MHRSRAVTLGLCALLGACGRGEPLEVLSPLPEDLLAIVEEAFEEANPDVDLRIERMDDVEGLTALLGGEERPDVWLGAARHHLILAASMGRLAEGEWTPLLASPVVLALNRDSVPLARAPRDWIDLFHPRWNDEVVLTDPARTPTMRALIEGVWLEELRRTGDPRAGADWLLKLDGVSRGYVEDDGEALRTLRVGRASFALLPLHVVLAAAEESEWLAWRLPESGGPDVVRGVAVLADSPRSGAAAALVSFLAGPAGRDLLDGSLGWLPAAGEPDLAPGAVREQLLGRRVWSWSRDTVTARGEEWMQRWDQEVRGRGRERLVP